VWFGTLVLGLGGLVYVTVRAPDGVWWMPAMSGISVVWSEPFAGLSGSLPSFLHTAGLALLITGILGIRGTGAAWACAAWTAVELLFEIGQTVPVRNWLLPLLPSPQGAAWGWAVVRGYFVHSTFDPFDLVAAVFGGTTAYLATVWPLSQRGKR